MSENKSPESANAGSSEAVAKQADPNKLGEGLGESVNKGAPNKPSEEMVPKGQYAELEKKLGEQGEELGKYRSFVEDLTPLIEKLDSQPELIKAIIDGKIDSNLAQAVMDGKVSIKEAEQVTQAHEEVKKELGNKDYQKAKPEEVEKLVSERLGEINSSFEKKLSSIKGEVDKTLAEERQIRDYEKKLDTFFKSTPDFADYSQDVNKYLDEHPNIDDIEVAYDAVKGRRLSKEREDFDQRNKAETAKEVASNVGGGASRNANIITNNDDISKFINVRGANPNKL